MTEHDVGTTLFPNKEIMLYSYDKSKKLNIYPQVKAINIFESLENFSMVAEFFVADGIDLMNNFPLGGEEVIELTFQTPERRSVTYTFLVESIQGFQTNEMGNLNSYKLQCVTKDYLKNASTVFTRRYRDMKYHEAIAECIMTDLGGEVPMATLEDTKGMFDYVVNGKRPFQVVDLIKERAVSNEQNKSSTFMFYQDVDGYHFTTIEKLIKDRKPGATQKKFFYDVANKASPYDKVINVRNILAFNRTESGSSINKVFSGAVRNQFREFDIMKGSYFLIGEYVNSADHTQFEATDDSNDFNSPAYNGDVEALPSITRMVVKDGLRPEMEHNKALHYQRAFTERMKQSGVTLKSYGDTDIRVGDIIELDIPEITGTTDAPPTAGIFAKNYIITSINHTLEQRSNGAFEHFIIMQCAKPNQFGKSLG